MTLLTWMRPNPFDGRTVVLAKHAQHVVLIAPGHSIWRSDLLSVVVAFSRKEEDE